MVDRIAAAASLLTFAFVSGCSGSASTPTPTVPNSQQIANQPAYPSVTIDVTADAGSTPIPLTTGLPVRYQVYVDKLVPGTPYALYGCWSANAGQLTVKCPAMAVSLARSDGTAGWSASAFNWISGAPGEFWYFVVVVRTAPHLPPLIPALDAGALPPDAVLFANATSHVIFQ